MLSVMLATSLPLKLAVMSKPDRIVVDLPEVNFQLAPDLGRKPQGLIKSARFGLFAPGRSRIVIELTGPALPKAEVSPVLGGAAHKLDLTLDPVSAEAFQRAVQASAPLPEGKKAELPTVPQGDSRPTPVAPLSIPAMVGSTMARQAWGKRSKRTLFWFLPGI